MSRLLRRISFVLIACGFFSPTLAEEWSRERARHLLSRTSFFYTAEQVDRVTGLGRDHYLKVQLSPEPESSPYLRLVEHRSLKPKEIYESLIDQPNATTIIEEEMMRGRLIRGLTSQYQLREVMTDFWFNHFNADPDKGPVVACNVARLEGDLRRHALGNFEDLLKVALKNPAVLDNLDNTVSSGKSVNENLGREVMELYTTGPIHTQSDVVEMARVLSGWSYDSDSGSESYLEYRYLPRLHASGPKTVLGRRFGDHEQEKALEFLAHHPATAEHVSRKLVTRFVSDEPPQELIDKASATYTKTGGDISAVLRTVLASQEFYEPRYRGSKLKTSTEYIVSAVAHSRPDEELLYDLASNGVTSRRISSLWLAMGSPYSCPNPLGWPDKSSMWTSGSCQRQRWYLAELLSERVGLPKSHQSNLFSPEFQQR